MKLSLLTATLAFLTTYHWFPQHANAATCTITKYNVDDIRRVQSECTQIIIDGITVPAGKTLALTELQGGNKVIFSGTITWDYMEWNGPLLSIAGPNIEITGAPGHVLDGRGNLWWDGKGSKGGKKKPRFFEAKLMNGQIHDIKIKNSPAHVFSIYDSSNVEVKNVTIDNSAGNSHGALNTDAFDVRDSSNIGFTGCTITSQGDCLTIHSGSNTNFLRNYCYGGGITIGPVGGGNAVANGVISNCAITNSDNGISIKTLYGAIGGVSGIMYQDITLTSIHKYGIVIEGDYQNGIPTGTPTVGVPIANLNMHNIHGTVDPSGVNVYILVEGASHWVFSAIDITGGTKTKRCIGIPPDAGISC